MPEVRVTLFWTTSVGATHGVEPILLKTDEILKKYGMSLDCTPGYYPTSQFTLDWKDPIDVDYDPKSPGLTLTKGHANALKLRALGDAAFKDTKPRLPIFFVKMLGAPGYTFVETGWWPWCIIDVSRPEIKPEVMLHEMGHAALLKHYQKYDTTSKNIMSYAPVRSEFTPVQVSKIWNSYFLNGTAPEKGWETFDFE